MTSSNIVICRVMGSAIEAYFKLLKLTAPRKLSSIQIGTSTTVVLRTFSIVPPKEVRGKALASFSNTSLIVGTNQRIPLLIRAARGIEAKKGGTTNNKLGTKALSEIPEFQNSP